MSANRWVRRFFGALLMVVMIGAVPADARPRHRVYVPVAPPPPIVETRIVAPGPGFVWVPGFYTWDGVAYVWVPGRWVRPPRVHAVWVPARWVHDDKLGWFYIAGHWR
jgi:hypothetical protein